MNSRILSAGLGLLVIAGTAAADYKDDIGYTKLANELGGALPSGTNISVSQVESYVSLHYMPNVSTSELSGIPDRTPFAGLTPRNEAFVFTAQVSVSLVGSTSLAL